MVEINENVFCLYLTFKPCWCDGEIIPTKVAHILLENIEENTSDDDDDDEDSEEEESEEESSDSEDDD